jgi:hypothetical protein
MAIREEISREDAKKAASRSAVWEELTIQAE